MPKFTIFEVEVIILTINSIMHATQYELESRYYDIPTNFINAQ